MKLLIALLVLSLNSFGQSKSPYRIVDLTPHGNGYIDRDSVHITGVLNPCTVNIVIATNKIIKKNKKKSGIKNGAVMKINRNKFYDN